MPIIETKFAGRWAKIRFESTKSKNVYEIDCLWDKENEEWESVSCTCMGFANRMTCRHLKEVEGFLKDFSSPTDEPNPQLKTRFWLHCGICNCCEFMIRPPSVTKDCHNRSELVCSQCGRMYLL